jgi:hypothetical protein
MPVRVARMECQTVGVEWPTVTRPAGSTNDQILLAASRSCVCGHPVYDDQEPGCPLCACHDHRPRPSAARERSILFPAGGLRRGGEETQSGPRLVMLNGVERETGSGS